MLENYDYDKILETYFHLYINDYGKSKFAKIAEKISTSDKISALIRQSNYHRASPTVNQILYCINGILYFMLSSNRTQALAALLTLQRWNNEVNSIFFIVNENTLKKMSLGIIKELKASTVNNLADIQDVEKRNQKSKYEKLRDSIFFPSGQIELEEFKKRIAEKKYKESATPSYKIITCNYSFNWKELDDIAYNSFENSINLISYFDKEQNFLKLQLLEFDQIDTPCYIYLIISTNSGWIEEDISSHKSKGFARSKDGKYTVELLEEQKYDDVENQYLFKVTYL